VNCALCEEPPGDVVFEDEWARVILHEDWSPRGHAMVASRRHVENASDLDEEEFAHLARVWHRAERVLLDATRAERAIILKLGIMTPHLHLHIYPISSATTREEVFAAIDGKARTPREEGFVKRVRHELTF
jgi:diadenosine tetraphosphate (Ap4A) HIT family hydrolase